MKTYAQRLTELETTYVPESKFFTTEGNANYVKKILGLADLNDFELQNMRDMAVMFFARNIDEARCDRNWDEYDRQSTMMMSVTAVIDSVKYNRGIAV